MTFFHGRKREGRNFVGVAIHFGGFGASKHGDGETGLSFPFNSGNIPIEVSEIDAAIFYTRKELLVDLGGPGEFRGGLGQLIEMCIPDGDLGPDGPVVAGLRGHRVSQLVRIRCSGGSAAARAWCRPLP